MVTRVEKKRVDSNTTDHGIEDTIIHQPQTPILKDTQYNESHEVELTSSKSPFIPLRAGAKEKT